MKKIFYRCAGVTRIHTPILDTWELLKETPKGYWIRPEGEYGRYSGAAKKKWVSKTARNRFAYPTEKEAVMNFFYRKKRQIKILEVQLDSAKTDLFLIKKYIGGVNG